MSEAKFKGNMFFYTEREGCLEYAAGSSGEADEIVVFEMLSDRLMDMQGK